jgi:trans-2,3-dihydro-3-hydroxyanthranilate isomerase
MANFSWSGKRYRQVDVFAEHPLSGNGLCVFWEGGALSTADMQALTIELRQFESIFLERTGAKEFTARIFTTEEELDFAGHPVLGGAAVLHEKYASDAVETWTLRMRKGDLRVRTEKRGEAYFATMYQPPAIFGAPEISQASGRELMSALNLDTGDLYPGLPLELVSTGLPYIVVPLQSNLGKAEIVIRNFEELIQRHGAKFVYLYDVDNSEGRTWDNRGKVEDIATGSAAGPVAAYLCKHGRLTVNQELTIEQGQHVGRPSRLRVKVLGAPGDFGEVEVSGSVQMVSEGTLS